MFEFLVGFIAGAFVCVVINYIRRFGENHALTRIEAVGTNIVNAIHGHAAATKPVAGPAGPTGPTGASK